MKNELMNIINLLKVKLLEVENKSNYDEDYDYNSGLEDGLSTAIEVIKQIA